MNKTIRIFISFLLSAFILLGGSGLIIGKMVCLKSGHTVFAAKEMKDCCDLPESGYSFNDRCCDISSASFVQGDFVHTNHTLVKASAAYSICLFANHTPELAANLQQQIFISDVEIPPGRYGESAQVFLSTFRI